MKEVLFKIKNTVDWLNGRRGSDPEAISELDS